MTTGAVRDTVDREAESTPLELLFDLVFVFAVSQLSRHLHARLSWLGVADTLVLLRAAYTVWFITSWSATIIPADQPRTRWMMVAVMLLGLFMNAALTRAFDAPAAGAWAFVGPLVAIQLGRTVWTLINAPNAVFRDHYYRTLAWFIATTPLWLAGAAVDPLDRLLLWAIAAAVDLVGAWLAHPVPGRRLHSENVPFNADHMLERCRLFLLIALGETIFTTGTAIAAAPVGATVLLTGTMALAGTVALWALNYGRSHCLILRYVADTTNPVRASQHAVSAVMVMVAGLIAEAVANQLVIARPDDATSVAVMLVLFGGPILFLAAQGWYLWAVPRVAPRVHLAGILALALVGCAASFASRVVALVLATATLACVVAADWRQSSCLTD